MVQKTKTRICFLKQITGTNLKTVGKILLRLIATAWCRYSWRLKFWSLHV